jgi:malate/lactate dehydrogenase
MREFLLRRIKMKVAVVGTGNVGSALLIHLADVPSVEEILVMNVEDDWSKAAIMDVASAKPEAALKMEVAPFRRINEPDILVLTSGVQMKEGETGKDVLSRNLEVMNTILDTAPLKSSATVIGLATPVDDVTAHIQKRYGLPHPHVLGFGGDLDRNRLAYVLSLRGIPNRGIHVVGEHGKNTVPVYEGEKDFDEVKKKVGNFLGDITTQGGRPRNLATGLLLARLVESIVMDLGRVHHVCSYHSEHGLYLTWPYRIGRKGVLGPEPVILTQKAKESLTALIEKKKR